jgi:hypothetical protein
MVHYLGIIEQKTNQSLHRYEELKQMVNLAQAQTSQNISIGGFSAQFDQSKGDTFSKSKPLHSILGTGPKVLII